MIPQRYRPIHSNFRKHDTHDGKETVKLLSLYSIEKRQPVAFTKQLGNLPDVISIENALKRLQALGIGNAEIITDNGYYSDKNLAECCMLISISSPWSRPI